MSFPFNSEATLMRPLQVLLRPFRPLVGVLRATRRTGAAVPDVVDAILMLPRLARQLELVAFQTATLLEMHEELTQIQSNTAGLPQLNPQIARVHEVLCNVELNTQAVQQLTDVALPLHGAALRIGRLADRLPQRRADTNNQRSYGG
jgi:hypothetical protein